MLLKWGFVELVGIFPNQRAQTCIQQHGSLKVGQVGVICNYLFFNSIFLNVCDVQNLSHDSKFKLLSQTFLLCYSKQQTCFSFGC
jgi:hypothetical protein